MGNQTPNAKIPVPYPASAGIDELFDWERFLLEAFTRVDTSELLFASRVRIWGGGNPPVAIQTLLNDLGTEGGGILLIPAGTHIVNATLNVPANVLIIGQRGAEIRPSATFYNSGDVPIFNVQGDGVRIKGIRFLGHPLNNDVRVSAVKTNGYDTIIEDCHFERLGYSAVDHTSSTNTSRLLLKDSVFYNCFGDCILTNLPLEIYNTQFLHPSDDISTYIPYRAYGVGIKANTQAGVPFLLKVKDSKFEDLLRTCILLTDDPSHPEFRVEINGCTVKRVGLERFTNKDAEASAIGNDESLFGGLIYVKTTSSDEGVKGKVYISNTKAEAFYTFFVRMPVNNSSGYVSFVSIDNCEYVNNATAHSGFTARNLRIVEGVINNLRAHSSFIRHIDKASSYGYYNLTVSNSTFSGNGGFSTSGNADFYNCNFGNNSAPTGRLFVGCKGGAQINAERAIACTNPVADTGLKLLLSDLGLSSSNRLLEITRQHGSPVRMYLSGKLINAVVKKSLFLPPTAFVLLLNDDTTTPISNAIGVSNNPFEIYGDFDVGTKPPANQHRRFIAVVPMPHDMINISNESTYSFNIRILLTFVNGRTDLIPIRVRVGYRSRNGTSQTMTTVKPFGALTSFSTTAGKLTEYTTTIKSALPTNEDGYKGLLVVEVARQYVNSDPEFVRFHGVEIDYDANLKAGW